MVRMAASGALACVAATGLAQSPTFSTRVDLVRLDVLVSDGRLPIRDLNAADFEIRDNGVLQTLEHARFEELPLQIVLTLDASASVIGARLDHLLEASDALLQALTDRDEAALITFSHAVVQTAGLTAHTDGVRAALKEVEPEGDTALLDGVYTALNVADRSSGRSLVMVFSDGRDTASWLSEGAVIDAARRSDAVVYAVAAGVRKRSFLQQITNVTGGRLYEVESTRNLRGIFLSVLEEFRQRYLLSYSPRGVEQGGWHRVDVRLKGRRATVRTRPGYLAPTR